MDRGDEEPEELFLFFEAEEKFPLKEKTSSVQELMTMVGSAEAEAEAAWGENRGGRATWPGAWKS